MLSGGAPPPASELILWARGRHCRDAWRAERGVANLPTDADAQAMSAREAATHEARREAGLRGDTSRGGART